MSTVLTCADCSTQYALDLNACPHCGSSDYVGEVGVITQRLPLFVTLRCDGCGRGPWTVRLESKTSGLIELPTLACTSCGTRVPVTWPPEEKAMSPKITTHGGATNARAAEVSPAADASEPLVGAEADQGRPTPEPEPEVEAEAQEEEAAEPETTDEEPAEDEADEPVSYEGMTLAELREEADKRQVPSYGTKAQITERLREADQA